MPEKSYLEALLGAKCPRCRKGDMFIHPATKLLHFNAMHEKCPYCKVRLQPEPGFYQGAMYVSYGFLIVVMLIISLILYYLAGDPSEWIYIGVVITVMIIIIPLNYRYSRVVYLYLLGGIKYDPNLSK